MQVDKKFHSKMQVAVQRLSSTKDIHGNNLKEWPKEEMRKLIDYCRLNNIDIINVCPHDECRQEYSVDKGNLSLTELFDYLCEIDLFIGIDSSIGHMCALTGTPNLNLYFSRLSRSEYPGHIFMPLSMSYTLFAKDNYPKGESVIKAMNSILFESKKLSSEFLPLTERRDGLQYEFV